MHTSRGQSLSACAAAAMLRSTLSGPRQKCGQHSLVLKTACKSCTRNAGKMMRLLRCGPPALLQLLAQQECLQCRMECMLATELPTMLPIHAMSLAADQLLLSKAARAMQIDNQQQEFQGRVVV